MSLKRLKCVLLAAMAAAVLAGCSAKADEPVDLPTDDATTPPVTDTNEPEAEAADELADVAALALDDAAEEDVPHAWIYDLPPVIAHAGAGIWNEPAEKFDVALNSLETIDYSYERGFRIFEYDFNLTSDGVLVVIHDWPRMGGILSEEEFLQRKISEKYTTMTIDDVFDAMIRYPDMYLITDTKSFSYTDEQIVEQFSIIRDSALIKSPELLDRIIPQIYNRPMYDLICSVYDFESIIFTLYATNDTLEQVVEFVRDKDNIPVIVREQSAVTAEFCETLRAEGKLVYAHTINSEERTKQLLDMGVHGIYTDTISPDEFFAIDQSGETGEQN